MQQVLLYPKAAAPAAYDLPDPAPQAGQVIITNRASLISPGTERAGMEMHKASLLTKARRRPDLVKQVIDKVRTEGVFPTIRKVRSRLAEPFAPGYSCAGVIAQLGPGVEGYSIGDRVAAAGQGYASHAEVVSVPKNLTAKIPEGVTFAEAACGTLGAIAMHAVRITSPALGETVIVVGLGILGQLTAQILQAAGVNVIAVEPDSFRQDLARQSGIAAVTSPGEPAMQATLDFTQQRGADAVIITAASHNEELISESTRLVRDRGVITIVGDVPLTLSRRLFYGKELQLRLSRSYGPGRYDRQYEEKGHDYPYPYVRWTQKRNIEAFLDLLALKKVLVEHLITDRFDIQEVEKAYDLLTDPERNQHLAVLFVYPEKDHLPLSTTQIKKPPCRARAGDTLGVGFIGFGQFAAGVLLPAFESVDGLQFTGVATTKGITAHTAAMKGGFTFATTDHTRVIKNPETDIVVIAATHDLHADLAIEVLQAGKIAFLEKPMALDPDGLAQLVGAVRKHGGLVQVGFNRRYSPALICIKKALAERTSPLSIDYRVCPGPPPSAHDHWVTDPDIGGGRMIGEICHFIDAVSFLAEAHPKRVYAHSLGTNEDDDAVALTLELTDGSMANIRYLTKASPGTPKEQIDILGGGITAYVNDFRSYGWTGRGRSVKKRGMQNKGHAEQIKALLDSVRHKGQAGGNFVDAVYATQTTFAARESLRSGKPVAVHVNL